MAATPLVGDAEGKILGDPVERWCSQTCPGIRRTLVAVDVFEPGGAELLDIGGVEFDEEKTRRAGELDTAAQRGTRVATDADAVVGEQDGPPGSLGR